MNEMERFAGNQPSPKTGGKPIANFATGFKLGIATFYKTIRKGENLTLGDWTDFFLKNYSKPPVRRPKTHEANVRAAGHLKKTFASRRLVDLTADEIEHYLRERLRQPIRYKTSSGFFERSQLKPTTVHQELRVLRRMLNVAVRKQLLPSNPCSTVEVPVAVRSLFRPHYVSWSEQQRIELHAPPHLRNVVRIITETGLRIYKELLPMKKEQVNLANALVWISDSKTPNGISELPLTGLALDAFRSQLASSGSGEFLFPSVETPTKHTKSLKKHGGIRSGEQGFRTSESMTSAPPTPRG